MQSRNRRIRKRRGSGINLAKIRRSIAQARKLARLLGLKPPRQIPPTRVKRRKPAIASGRRPSGKRPSGSILMPAVTMPVASTLLSESAPVRIEKPPYDAKGVIRLNLRVPKRIATGKMSNSRKSYAFLIERTFADREWIGLYLSSARVALGVEQDKLRRVIRSGPIAAELEFSSRFSLLERFKYLDNIALALSFPSAEHCHSEIKKILMGAATNSNPIGVSQKDAAVLRQGVRDKIRELIATGIWGDDRAARDLFRKGRA